MPSNGILMSYFLANLYRWGMANMHTIPGAWRLAQWTQRRQLRAVQQYGHGVEVFGPLCIENNGFIEIGNYVELRSSWHKPVSLFVVKDDAHLIIEDYAFINWGVHIGVAQKIVIGAYAQIGDECIIYDSDWHSLDGLDQNIPTVPTKIGRGVWLGARVMVLKGVTIGDNTVVAANSTVTQDLPGNVLAAGTPARVVRPIERRRYLPDMNI